MAQLILPIFVGRNRPLQKAYYFETLEGTHQILTLELLVVGRNRLKAFPAVNNTWKFSFCSTVENNGRIYAAFIDSRFPQTLQKCCQIKTALQ